ncbi:YbfB/YjiJ family MFS transporter, partial [Janthinobacterium svalbardensis]|uniref:YbfB/YjiJ family MFS transporter n=1 Tax=Janthinobacterium svalbardensis TaxID=368607 RepID=UPI002FCD9183
MSGAARLRSAIAAAAILAIGMGFGRFAFTAIYPHMVDEGVLSFRDGSLAASANYAGYLLGAILAMRARARGAYRLCLWSVAGTALCLGVLALPMPVWLIVAVRGAAGVFSALAMVAASLWLLVQCGHGRGAPLLYAGVGAGIAVSAELLVLAAHLGWHSAGMWLLLAGVAVLLGLAAAPAIA